MAGAWEIMSQARVLCGILHTDIVTMAWSLGFRNLQIPGDVLPVTGMPYDQSRNTLCMAALDGGYTHVFMLDSDVVPPSNAILKLLSHRVPLISGLYCRRSPPHGLPVMIKNGQWVTNYKPGSVIEVDVVGAGCLLISTDLLRKLPPSRPGYHWFDWRVNLRGAKDERGNPIFPEGECMSEDFVFNLMCRQKLGIPTLVDTSVVCKHVGLAEAGYMSFLPCHANPRT